jgi:hypothetical protein
MRFENLKNKRLKNPNINSKFTKCLNSFCLVQIRLVIVRSLMVLFVWVGSGQNMLY